MEKQMKNTALKNENRAGGRRFSSLGWRILIAMSLTALGPLIIMSYQGYLCAKEAVLTSQHAHLISVVESRRARLESWLAEIRSNIKFLSTISCTTKMCNSNSDKKCHSTGCHLMERLEQHSCCFENIMTYDKDWKATNTISQEFEAAMAHMQDSFKAKMVEGADLVASDPIKLKNDLFIYLGMPIVEPEIAESQGALLFNSDFPSYIVAKLTLTACVNNILQQRTGLGETGKVFTLDPDGGFINVPLSPDLTGKKSELPAKLTGAGHNNQSIVEYIDFRGEKVIGSAAQIPALNWTVVTEIDSSQALAWLGILRFRTLVTGTLTLFFVLFLSVTISSRLSKPLRKLATVSKQIADGSHSVRLDRLDTKEAQDVGEAFNTMLDELSASNKRLRHAASLAAVGELSTSIVHEMRNPLSSVKMNIKALQKKVKNDKVHSELAQIALDQARRLEKMLTDLLNYGKPLELNLGKIDFNKLANDAAEVVRSISEEKDITIEIANNLNNGAAICDNEQIWRALTNLTLNAVQAAPKGGKVRISASRSIEKPEMTELRVLDNGPGVDDSLMETVFQPFYTTRDEGTGLGLSNVKKIAEIHNGFVTVDNNEDGGAVFTIYIPEKGPT